MAKYVALYLWASNGEQTVPHKQWSTVGGAVRKLQRHVSLGVPIRRHRRRLLLTLGAPLPAR